MWDAMPVRYQEGEDQQLTELRAQDCTTKWRRQLRSSSYYSAVHQVGHSVAKICWE